MHKNLSHSLVPCFLCFLQPANNPHPPHATPPPTSFLLTLLTNQPSSSYSPLLPLPLLRAHAAAYYRSFPYFFFFFSTPQCVSTELAQFHIWPASLSFSLLHGAAGKQAMKRGKLISQTQLNQSNIWTLRGSLRERSGVLSRFSVVFSTKKKCFACHTLKEFNIFGVIDCNVAVFLRRL